MNASKLAGYIMIAIGGYFAIQAAMGVYGLIVTPPPSNAKLLIFGTLVVVGIPGLIAWLLIKYGRKLIA